MDLVNPDFLAVLMAMPVAFAIDPFAPPLVFGLCLRFHLIHDPTLLGAAFAGFASLPFLVVASGLYAAHALADKVPPIAHVMDAIGLVAKPLAVGFTGFWASGAIDPHSPLHWITLIVLIAGGVPATAAIQALRSKVRLAASGATLGAAIPVISAGENIAGLGLSALAFLQPVLAVVLILVVGLPLLWLSWLIIHRATQGAKGLLRAVGTMEG